MGLERYRARRSFARTPEPSGDDESPSKQPRFVVQKHGARRLHYDVRLEHGGVLWSWAVPKGPSLDPTIKRLAVQTEDHPLAYADFEGLIPAGEYGAGPVVIWDQGTWHPEGDPAQGMAKGHLRFHLDGHKLHGRWSLVRTKPSGRSRKPQPHTWLLIKHDDEAARPGDPDALQESQPESVVTGRDLPEVRADPDRVWHSERADPPPPEPLSLRGLRGMQQEALPKQASVQLATLTSTIPDGDAWIHEIKFDGVRLLVRLDKGHVQLWTRNQKDWTQRLPTVVRVLSALPHQAAWIDGELVVFQDNGISDFQRLQNALGEGCDEACVFVAFDILHLDGRNLQAVPLLERKALLQEMLAASGLSPLHVRYSDHVLGQGPAMYRHACEVGLEGIISKRADAPYLAGRSRSWLKGKCMQRQEFVVAGYTDPAGNRTGLGALLLASRVAGRWVYMGRVGTGFTERSLRELKSLLAGLSCAAPQIEEVPQGPAARGVHWVRPELVAEVEFSGLTQDRRLRHPSFKGLRLDKEPREVSLEIPRAPGAVDTPPRVRLTHPDKILYQDQGITKRELMDYYTAVASRMLPHVAGRIVTLLRCPQGQQAECFYQKHFQARMPGALRPVEMREKDKTTKYLMIEDTEGLLSLVQLGVLEIHVWGSLRRDMERPDRLVFDLDPDPQLSWSTIVEAACHVRDQLANIGLRSWVKTTGGKGLHVVVPIVPRNEWDGMKAFCKAFAERLEGENPGTYVTNMAKARRKHRIFIDYLRNSRGATAIAPYSTRARPGASVAVPVTWSELGSTAHGAHYDVRNTRRRLAVLQQDPWADLTETRQSITAAMKRAVGLD